MTWGAEAYQPSTWAIVTMLPKAPTPIAMRTKCPSTPSSGRVTEWRGRRSSALLLDVV
ncbi:MAG: hypothetical protein HIU86_00585 [Acidobacteria bacterium]|nr:hypothetical protein [Acidobacteriota bacterium]